MKIPLISVIVPIYNAEKYIERCVNSILLQTYDNIEVILVDDGSRDLSGSICEELYARDSRIKVIHQSNGGVTSARVAGLNISNGDFVTFVDADDRLLKSALSDLYENMLCDVDLVISDSYCTQKVSREIYVKDLLDNRISWCVWGKLFRRELFGPLISSISREFNIGEDLLMQLCIARKINNKVLYVSDKVYDFIGCQESATNTRTWSVTYEQNFIDEIKKQTNLYLGNYREPMFHLEMRSLKGLIVNSVHIDYTDIWFKKLLVESNDMTLSMEEKILLNVRNTLVARLLLAIKEVIWRIRKS